MYSTVTLKILDPNTFTNSHNSEFPKKKFDRFETKKSQEVRLVLFFVQQAITRKSKNQV